MKKITCADKSLVQKAILWVKQYHADQRRKTGEYFYTHPLSVAEMICDYTDNLNVIVSSILHDIVEDTEVTVAMLETEFNFRISQIVDRLTRYQNGKKISVAQVLDNAFYNKDYDVILVKLLDRLHNLQTIDGIKKNKQLENIQESIKEFVIMCAFLGKSSIEKQIKDICTKFLNQHENNDASPQSKLIDDLLENSSGCSLQFV